MGSSLSVWSVPRCCLSLAVPDFSHLGSSLSLRSSPDLERSSVCQDFRWPFEGASMTVLASFSPPLLVRGASRSGSSFSVAEEVFLGLSPLLHSLPHLSALVLCRHSRIPKGRFWCVALPTFSDGTVWTDKLGLFAFGI